MSGRALTSAAERSTTSPSGAAATVPTHRLAHVHGRESRVGTWTRYLRQMFRLYAGRISFEPASTRATPPFGFGWVMGRRTFPRPRTVPW